MEFRVQSKKTLVPGVNRGHKGAGRETAAHRLHITSYYDL